MEDNQTQTASEQEQAERKEKEEARRELEQEYGQVWDTNELCKDFDVISFLAPCVTVVRKSDGARGLMWFQHSPRFYFNFKPD